MDINTFLDSVSTLGLQLPPIRPGPPLGRAPEKTDAIFHLPLLALVTMIIARRMPFQTIILGRCVAMLLVEHFSALRRSEHGLETSLTLRRRCADSLAFLEAAQLVTVSADHKRVVELTKAGKTHIDRAARNSNDLGLLIRQLQICQERAKARIGNNER